MGCLLCVRYHSEFCVCVIWLMLSSTGWRRYHDYIPFIDLETQAQGSPKPLGLQSQHCDSRVLASKCYSILPPRQMFYISGPPRKGEPKMWECAQQRTVCLFCQTSSTSLPKILWNVQRTFLLLWDIWLGWFSRPLAPQTQGFNMILNILGLQLIRPKGFGRLLF